MVGLGPRAIGLVLACAALLPDLVVAAAALASLAPAAAAGRGGVAAVFASGTHEDLLVWLLIGFIAFFGFSQGAVIWVYISEVFPNRVRAKGQSLGSFTHWVMNAGISWAFPIMAVYSKSLPFVFFSAMMALQFAVVLFIYPETKGVTLEDMQKKLAIT